MKINDTVSNPLLRTYKMFKLHFERELYLDQVKDFRYRNAITRLRTSSHTLEIERGRHRRPKICVENRLCLMCKSVEDERHFLIDCLLYDEQRQCLFSKIITKDDTFCHLSGEDKFIYLLTSGDQQILTWVGKFIYRSFEQREIYISKHTE